MLTAADRWTDHTPQIIRPVFVAKMCGDPAR